MLLCLNMDVCPTGRGVKVKRILVESQVPLGVGSEDQFGHHFLKAMYDADYKDKWTTYYRSAMPQMRQHFGVVAVRSALVPNRRLELVP